jgi:2-(1,2-epoxy-1,2-dihydrophenyl)acetyl-CoA isomerase
MNPPTVLYETTNAVATITLNRPEMYNAFNTQLHGDLVAALRNAERDGAVRCVVLTGAGKAFCSGQDLKDVPLDRLDSLADVIRNTYNPMVMKLRNLGKPVIAAVNGVAAGAGMSLALACDLRVAVEGARFVAAFARIGLVPDSGMTYFLPRLIGPARAAELCMLGGEVDAQTALQWGMINAVASAEEFPNAVASLAKRLAEGPSVALGLMKRALELSATASLETMLEYEAMAQQSAGSSPQASEGIAAFREKRKANFSL